MIEPLGNLVIVKPDLDKKMSEIIEVVENARNKLADTNTGYVHSWGEAAWLDPALGGEPQVEKGDHVMFAKYGGKNIKIEEDGKMVDYIVVNDKDILVKLEK